VRVRDILDADTAAVLLLDPDRNELVARAAMGIEEVVDRGVRIPVGQGFAGKIAQQRSPVILDRVDDTTVVNPILSQKGIRSLLGVPLIAHGDILGVMHVGKKTQHRFTEEEVELLQLVADRVALALEVRLADRARTVVDAFQRTFLPDVLPYVPGLRVATKYLPAASAVGIGGDWYDTFALPSGEIVLAIGDVAGHGIRAASLMGKLRNALRAGALMGGGPSDVVARLDEFHRHFGEDELVTLLFGVLARDLSTLRFVAAGHAPPLVVQADGARFATNGHSSPPLGLAQPPTFAETEIPLRPGTSVLLYTDGLVERRDESLEDGLERLRAAAARIVTGSEPAEAITELVDDVLGPGRPADDVALMLVQRDARPSERLEFAIEARSRSIPLIRRAVLRWLEDHGVSNTVAMEVVTAVSEASANAVEHAYGPAGGSITVAATIAEGEVEAIVRDTGRWRGASRGDRGQGLRLIRGLMDEVRLDASEVGTTVTMLRRATG
jgi:serine phosphatase RsbU (regulator of sigma subunit)/anti-sigma regulatory factor (Ser/Thr protein kinase)